MTSIWQSPPFAKTDGKPKGTFEMGLTPIGLDLWLTPAHAHPRMAEKLRCLSDASKTTYRAADDRLADVHAAEEEVSSQVALFAESPLPEQMDSKLVAACHVVFDDLCIIDRKPISPMLISGCVASPSYWRLEDKVGRPISEVHAPVVGLNEKLGARINEFFQRLPDERLFERRNWFVHTSEALHQNDSEPEEDFQSSALILRSERQTLRAFGRWVCFSIAVSTHPLSQMTAVPGAVDSLSRALDQLDGEELEHFGGSHKREAILARLRERAPTL